MAYMVNVMKTLKIHICRVCETILKILSRSDREFHLLSHKIDFRFLSHLINFCITCERTNPHNSRNYRHVFQILPLSFGRIIFLYVGIEHQSATCCGTPSSHDLYLFYRLDFIQERVRIILRMLEEERLTYSLHEGVIMIIKKIIRLVVEKIMDVSRLID